MQYALLFPGEALAMSGVAVSPHNIWTIYLRAMLLLHLCVHKRGDPRLTDGDRAQFAMRAWLEIDAMESTLNQHSCVLALNVDYRTREMLFESRMCVSHEFQRYIPQVSTYVHPRANKWTETDDDDRRSVQARLEVVLS